MEALGERLKAIGAAIGSIAGWTATFGIVSALAASFLIYTDKITFDDVKSLFKKDRSRY